MLIVNRQSSIVTVIRLVASSTASVLRPGPVIFVLSAFLKKLKFHLNFAAFGIYTYQESYSSPLRFTLCVCDPQFPLVADKGASKKNMNNSAFFRRDFSIARASRFSIYSGAGHITWR